MLTLYELDRAALQTFTEELREALLDDDAEALGRLLELADSLRGKLGERPLVEWFLLPEEHPDARPLHASLRRISKKRALTKVLTSSHAGLEGRLRNFEVLREDRATARRIDKLLSLKRLPWYLRPKGATGGWLGPQDREALAESMGALRGSLTPELSELAGGLAEADGDVVLHDRI
ncbi:MAG: hypothetical protein KC731_34840 [Myxococcales bacterium]|nr:hypothetical protein [Myxococcales bacterium]